VKKVIAIQLISVQLELAKMDRTQSILLTQA
jgi:hypothetical protein